MSKQDLNEFLQEAMDMNCDIAKYMDAAKGLTDALSIVGEHINNHTVGTLAYEISREISKVISLLKDQADTIEDAQSEVYDICDGDSDDKDDDDN